MYRRAPSVIGFSGRVEFGLHSGPARYLTDEEELVNFICGCASMGYAKTKIY